MPIKEAVLRELLSLVEIHDVDIEERPEGALIVSRKFFQAPYHREISLGFSAQAVDEMPPGALLEKVRGELQLS